MWSSTASCAHTEPDERLEQPPHHHRTRIKPALLVASVNLIGNLLDVPPRPTNHREGKDELIRWARPLGRRHEARWRVTSELLDQLDRAFN